MSFLELSFRHKEINFTFNCNSSSEVEDMRWLLPIFPKKKFFALLNGFKHAQEILLKYNISLLAEGGTYIGAIRNKGFLPFDDDVDVYYDFSNFDQLNDTQSQLHKDLETFDLWIEVYEKVEFKVRYGKSKSTSLVVLEAMPYHINTTSNKVVLRYKNPSFTFTLDHSRIFPLQKMPFNDFYVYGPKDNQYYFRNKIMKDDRDGNLFKSMEEYMQNIVIGHSHQCDVDRIVRFPSTCLSWYDPKNLQDLPYPAEICGHRKNKGLKYWISRIWRKIRVRN